MNKKIILKFHLLIMVLMILFQLESSAQVSVMNFTSSSGTYSEITGGTLLGSTTSDDQYFVDPGVPLGGTTRTGPGFPIGFDFVINGNTFDRFGINNNGWISLGKSALSPSVDMNTSSSYNPLSSTTAITPPELRTRIAGLGRDLQAQTGAELRYELLGTAPNRTLVIQWKGYRKFGATGDDYNFQIRLNETSNTVEIVYGTMTNNATSATAQVGIGGSTASDFNNRTTTTDWTASSPGTTNSASMTLSSTVFPPSGLTYEWSTPSDLPPTISFTPLTNTSSTSNRVLTAQITDDFGIAGAPNDPRLYFKKKSDVSFVYVNPSSVVGDNYTFTFDYSLLSSSVVSGDTIVYYIAAQDNAGQTTTNPVGGSGTPPGINPPANFESYRILQVFALPYLQDFNAGTSLPPDWGGNMLVLANHGTSGSNGLTRNLYSSVTTANSTTPIVGPITSNSELVFDYRIVNWSGYPNNATTLGADQFFIRISTDDGNTYNTVYTIDSSNHVVSTSFATITIPIGAYSGQNIVVRWDLQWASGDYYFDIDNVKIRETPLGPPNPAIVVSPADNATNVDINTSLNWLSGGGAPETGYRIYFGTDGGGVTPPTNILNNVDLGLVTSYTPASPLSYNTTYYWMIVPYNGSGDATGNAIWSFTTGADPTITSFPYVQDFEGSFPPTGWSNYGTKLWTQTLTGGLSGSKGARVSYTPAGSANLQTPPVVLPAAPHRIKFWWKDNDIFARPLSNNGEASEEGPEIIGQDTTYFEISTDAGTTWTSLAFLSAASPQSAYSEVFVDLTSYANQTVSFRWRDESNGTSSAYGTGLDQITIEEIPATPIFVITPTSQDFGTAIVGNTVSRNFTISNTGSVTLTINTGGITLTGANADQFSLGSITYPINLNNGESTQITVDFAPTSAGSKSANLEIVHNAPGSPAVVPLTGNALPAGILFEDFTGTTFPPEGWLTINNDGGTKNWVRNTGKFNSAPASASSSWESSTLRNDDWLITPKLSVASGDSIIFWVSAASISFPEELVLKVGNSANPNGVWTTIDSIIVSSTSWERKSYSLDAFAGQNVYIAFVNRGLDQFTVYLDDIIGPTKYVTQNDLGIIAYEESQGTLRENIFSPTGISRDISAKLKNDQSNSEILSLNRVELSILSTEKANLTVEAPVNFKAVVKNFGALTQNSYQVAWTIDGNVQTPVSNTQPLVSGASDTLTLTWASPTEGLHQTRAWVVLAGDENPLNDTSAVVNFYVSPANTIFSERFEGTFPPAGWLTVNRDGGGLIGPWFAGNPAVFVAFEGNGYAADNFNTANGFYIDDYLITPNTGGLVEGTSVDSLVFWAYSNPSIYPDSLQILVSTTGTDTADFTTVLGYIAVPKTGWTRLAFELPNSANRYIAFRYLIYDGGPSGNNSDYFGIDAVEIHRHTSSPSTFQLTVNVSNGWNMVSVPGQHPVDQNVTTWWSGKDPAANVFKFQGAYQPVTTVQPGLGYWMKHLGANTYNTGDEWPAGGINIVPHDPLTATAGWNLIGGYEFLAPTAALTTTPSGLISGFVYGYTPGTGYQVASDLVPGYGYWVKLTAAGQINVNPGPKANFKLSDFIPDDFAKIIITDNAGKSYTLYVAQGKQAQKTSLDLFELPPVPFTDMFDVRYTSGRFVEDLGSAMKTIQMQGVEYPVRVRVEGMMLRITDETGKAINERVKSGEEITISNSQISKLNVMSDIIPDKYSLEQNYPNPFNPTTTIEFSLPEDVENVRLTIYNALGEKVAELVNGKMEAGRYRYQWNAGNVATGLYIYELKTNKFSSVKKMMLLK
ncbi:choice-of-anchor J domain-containing protein [Ignavibacterium sp.]|uniref:T9SS-dependent choice-of-anchor J family protein n=1 Tax=Ignavibacterium sp. TaxID=2651167 RepID=UPI0022068646|nr:choice-of-anchor J domain-containing protein [Ignavibacterium sp.]BDQ02176.1 MAG: hypothetical protein KatS3mg037_0751 [Ignavibacterium sp.]